MRISSSSIDIWLFNHKTNRFISLSRFSNRVIMIISF